MSLKDDLESDLEMFFDADEFGETGDYTSKDAGETVEVRLIVDYGQIPGSDVANTTSSHATAHIPKSDLPAPARSGDTISIAGLEWSVIRQASGDNNVVSLELRRDARNRYKK
jgi:hypothetical protein